MDLKDLIQVDLSRFNMLLFQYFFKNIILIFSLVKITFLLVFWVVIGPIKSIRSYILS